MTYNNSYKLESFNYSVPKSVDNSAHYAAAITATGRAKAIVLLPVIIVVFYKGLTNPCCLITSLLPVKTKHAQN